MKPRIDFSLAILCFTALAAAQPPDSPAQRGVVPNAAYSVSGLDVVNLRSGNLALHVPLAALPAGPGGSGAQLGLAYNSQIYDLVDQLGETVLHKLVPSTTGGGWRYTFQYSLFEEPRPYDPTTGLPDCSTEDNAHQYKQYLVFPDGSRHPLRMDLSNSGLDPTLQSP